MSESYTTADVQKHKDEANGFWLIVENDVYDVTSMVDSYYHVRPVANMSYRLHR